MTVNKRNMDKLSKNRNLWCGIFIFIFLGMELLCSVLSYNKKAIELRGPPSNGTVKVQKPVCPDVSNGMMRGRWKSRPLSSKEETEIAAYLEHVRSNYSIPKSMQREDGKCGRVTYQNLFWFRALCNPKGPTPCCFDGQCVVKSPDDCRCTDCYDLRNRIHAEYSTWIPKDPQCIVKNFTSSDACQLLHDAHLFMVGDSFTEQLYVSLLLILANNQEEGAYRPDITREIHGRCRGMYTYVNRWCRRYIKKDANVCKNYVSVSARGYYSLAYARQFHNLAQSLLHMKNTVIFVGIGYHDSFSFRVYHDFLLPVILMMESQAAVWPRIIWSTNHQFGILKPPHREGHSNRHIEIFNNFLTQQLRQYKIPIFDTFNMTSGVMSQDGSHYGIGLNLMKAQMFLNFLQELKYNEGW